MAGHFQAAIYRFGVSMQKNVYLNLLNFNACPMKKIARLLIIVIFINSCATLKELITFTKCEFRVKSVREVTLAGVNLNRKTAIADFTMDDFASVAQAVIRGVVPMDFYIDLEAKNPNTQNASIDKIEWIVYIDDQEILTGTIDQKVSVPANNGLAIIPLKFQVDLKKIARSSAARSLAEFALSAMQIGNHDSRLTVKIKPSVSVGSFLLTYPGYIKVTKEFSAGN